MEYLDLYTHIEDRNYVERTEDFVPALDRAVGEKGIRLLHLKTDVEQISHAGTIAKLREKAKG